MVDRRPFPIFNMGRGDLIWTLVLAVMCSAVVIILRSSQQDPPRGETVWKDVTIIFCSISSVIFALLSIVKAWCGYGRLGETHDYEDLDDSERVGEPILQATVIDTRVEEAQLHSLAGYEKSVGGVKEQLKPMVQPQTRPADSAQASARSVTQSYLTPRDEDDIHCGIELESVRKEFTFNGVKHPAGTLRIVRLYKDGVCERQGACVVGDILASVDGRHVTGMDVAKVEGLLQGKAGTSIILGLYTDQNRESISRHVVLAPSPSSVGLSPRDSSIRSIASSSRKVRP